jgi:Tfp pilus assembly protein PilV
MRLSTDKTCGACHLSGKSRVRRAFTLVEALIATFILALATVGIAQMLGASAQQAGSLQDKSISIELARQLMEEIASHSVADASGNISLGHEAGENSRSQYDQIDDYNLYHDTTSSLTMLDGTVVNFGNGQVYSRDVAVEYRMTPSGPATTSSSAPFCVVTVSVAAPNDKPATLVRLFARTSGGT